MQIEKWSLFGSVTIGASLHFLKLSLHFGKSREFRPETGSQVTGSSANGACYRISIRGSVPEPLQLRRTTQAPPARRIFSQSASAAAREGAGART